MKNFKLLTAFFLLGVLISSCSTSSHFSSSSSIQKRKFLSNKKNRLTKPNKVGSSTIASNELLSFAVDELKVDKVYLKGSRQPACDTFYMKDGSIQVLDFLKERINIVEFKKCSERYSPIRFNYEIREIDSIIHQNGYVENFNSEEKSLQRKARKKAVSFHLPGIIGMPLFLVASIAALLGGVLFGAAWVLVLLFILFILAFNFAIIGSILKKKLKKKMNSLRGM